MRDVLYDIGNGDTFLFNFSPLAVSRHDSIDVMSGEDIILHIKTRSKTGHLVINDRYDGKWGRECVLPMPLQAVTEGVLITTTFAPDGISVGSAQGEPAEFRQRFIVQGEASIRFREDIAVTQMPAMPVLTAQLQPTAVTEPSVLEDGYVEFYSPVAGLGGIIIDGWMRKRYKDGARVLLTCSFDDGEVIGSALICWHDRSDLGDLGTGFSLYALGLPKDAETQPNLRHVTISDELGTTRRLVPVLGLQAGGEAQAITLIRKAAERSHGGNIAEIKRQLLQPVYTGSDTLAPLGLPVHLEVDEVVQVQNGAAFLLGWKLDPQNLVQSVRLRCGIHASLPLNSSAILTERNDIVEAFSARYGVTDNRLGFLAYGNTEALRRDPLFLEITLAGGRTAYKPLPAPTRSGIAAIRRVLDAAPIAPDDVQQVFDVFGPPLVTMNRLRLASPIEVRDMTFGTPPAHPRVSHVIPLYGRLDFLRYQLALFSKGGMEQDEIIYVLDEPAKKATLLAMATAAYASFKVPFRILLPSTNRGFGPASNLGLSRARGRYVCFLNSDVFPESPGFFDRLTASLEADPRIGVIGGLLLFADGSVQHAGMDYETLPQFGSWSFPMHPGKGRLFQAGPEPVVVAPAVTGACMLMTRDLADELGGFDPDYVIGDFEDADLCDRIRARGLDCAVDHRARAFHLERQSQGDSAEAWRRNVTMLNAWTFNKRRAKASQPALAFANKAVA